MVDANSQEQHGSRAPSPPAATNGRLTRSMHVLDESARSAQAAIREHPFFAAGVLAGLGLVIGAALVLRANRRRSFLDIVMAWF